MVKRCIYCSAEVASDSVVDMCQRCMYQVWGEKMAKAIVEGMEKERDAGNLELGQVGASHVNNKKLEDSESANEEVVMIKEVVPEVVNRETIFKEVEVQEVEPEELVMETFDKKEDPGVSISQEAIEQLETGDAESFVS